MLSMVLITATLGHGAQAHDRCITCDHWRLMWKKRTPKNACQKTTHPGRNT